MRRREFILGAGAALAPTPASAQRRTRRVGFLFPGGASAMDIRMPAFREGLFPSAQGADPEIEIIPRTADGKIDRLPALASELLLAEVQVIVAVSPPAVTAARNATPSIPIVAHDLESDPIANGWAASLARPGWNLTGLFLDLPDVSVKC